MSGEPSFYEVTSLSDCVRRIIPAKVDPVIVREHYEGGLLTIEFLSDPDPNAALSRGSSRCPSGGPFQSFRFKGFEPDPNAAMIARDEPTGDHTPGETWGFRIDNRPFKWLDGEIVKSTAKPAITGLTTVHDGKVNGLGFCSDLGHE